MLYENILDRIDLLLILFILVFLLQTRHRRRTDGGSTTISPLLYWWHVCVSTCLQDCWRSDTPTRYPQKTAIYNIENLNSLCNATYQHIQHIVERQEDTRNVQNLVKKLVPPLSSNFFIQIKHCIRLAIPVCIHCYTNDFSLIAKQNKTERIYIHVITCINVHS